MTTATATATAMVLRDAYVVRIAALCLALAAIWRR